MVLQSACIDWIGPANLSEHFMSATSTANICVYIYAHLYIYDLYVCMCMWEHVVRLALSQTSCVNVLLRNPLVSFYNQHLFNGMERQLCQGDETGGRTRMDKMKLLYLFFTPCHVDQRKIWYLWESAFGFSLGLSLLLATFKTIHP